MAMILNSAKHVVRSHCLSLSRGFQPVWVWKCVALLMQALAANYDTSSSITYLQFPNANHFTSPITQDFKLWREKKRLWMHMQGTVKYKYWSSTSISIDTIYLANLCKFYFSFKLLLNCMMMNWFALIEIRLLFVAGKWLESYSHCNMTMKRLKLCSIFVMQAIVMRYYIS